MAVLLANNATSRLASSLTAAATTLSVTSGEGARFPSPSDGDWFPLTLIKSSGALEILRCTARSGDVFTVTRAQEGTAAQAFSAGDRVEVRLTKAVIDDLSNSALLDSNNLSDLANAETARSNLGLGTAATANAQTSPTDTTAGALMAVGAFGLGGILDLRSTVFEVGSPADIYDKGMVTGLARGGPDGLAIPAITSNDVFGVLTIYGHWMDASGGAASAWREFRTADSRVFHQYQAGGAWGAWQELLHTGNLLQTTGTSTGFPMSQAAVTNALASWVGVVSFFARNTAPAGWLKANGAAVSRTTYADLFAAIGTTFGAGDGSTTFNLPDLRGEFLRGWDDGRGLDAGRVFGSAQLDQFENHTHYSTASGWVTNGGNATGGAGVAYGNKGAYSVVSGKYGAETRPRNIALLACIKF